MKPFTIIVRCHITWQESEYKVCFPDEEALAMFFCGKKDKLVSVSDGWTNYFEWACEMLMVREVPHAVPVIYGPLLQAEYDYQDDLGEFC